MRCQFLSTRGPESRVANTTRHHCCRDANLHFWSAWNLSRWSVQCRLVTVYYDSLSMFIIMHSITSSQPLHTIFRDQFARESQRGSRPTSQMSDFVSGYVEGEVLSWFQYRLCLAKPAPASYIHPLIDSCTFTWFDCTLQRKRDSRPSSSRGATSAPPSRVPVSSCRWCRTTPRRVSPPRSGFSPSATPSRKRSRSWSSTRVR